MSKETSTALYKPVQTIRSSSFCRKRQQLNKPIQTELMECLYRWQLKRSSSHQPERPRRSRETEMDHLLSAAKHHSQAGSSKNRIAHWQTLLTKKCQDKPILTGWLQGPDRSSKVTAKQPLITPGNKNKSLNSSSSSLIGAREPQGSLEVSRPLLPQTL